MSTNNELNESNELLKINDLIKQKKINTISIFLYAKQKNQIIFLLGLENNTPYNKTDVNLYSEIHGQIINDESIDQAFGRIIFEKTMNLVDNDNIDKIINKLPYVIDTENQRVLFGYQINYTTYENIPKYFNKFFAYLNMCTSSNTLGHTIIESCPIGFLDKSELKWFDFNDIKKQENLFSLSFYKNLDKIIDKIILK